MVESHNIGAVSSGQKPWEILGRPPRGTNFPQRSKKILKKHQFCFTFAPFLVNNAGP